jgi:bifunctional UDP-N-acetylglucosamine pyrophosphorylase / glucosamine-1-phosphate N-acetyltransferase
VKVEGVSCVDVAVVLGAGKGTRFYSSLPKVLHPVCGRTMLERTIRALAPLVRNEIIVVAGFGYDEVVGEIDRIRLLLPETKITIVEQKEQKGTGHATQCGFSGVSEDASSVLVVPGDCPLIEKEVFQEFLEHTVESDFTVLSFEPEQPFGFGRIIKDDQGYLLKIVEEKDCSEKEKEVREVNSGILYARPSILKKYLPLLTTSNAQGEYYVTDIPELMKKDGVPVSVIKTSNPLLVMGANTRLELYRLESQKRIKDLEQYMRNGVSFESIESVFIDEGVEIGQDVFIGANTRLHGDTIIASGCVIEGDSLIRNSRIGNSCHIKLGSYVDEAILDAGVVIGPFCHIRPKSELSKGVKIGNFVETKNAKLAPGVKANHLTYLGDIEVGEESNIGAGTIICNYDGMNKFQSVVGKHSFIGSNSTLVSPVEVKDNAYIGAGSVITREVPSGALGIGRSRQQNLEGWVDKKKSGNKNK